MGEMARDFTYVDDLVEAILRLVDCVPIAPSRQDALDPLDSLSPAAPYRIVNIGLGQPVRLMDFIGALEAALDRKAVCRMLPMQPGEVVATFASADLLERLTGYRPATPVSDGIGRFVAWYREYQQG
jgi:UDP-glucuronate 4-epimerase